MVPSVSTETPVYYDLVVDPMNIYQRKFVEIKECRIRLRRLEVNVVETQHPILQMVSHPIMVRRFRKTIERTLRDMVVELVNTVNSGVEQIMEATREQPGSHVETEEDDVAGESATVPRRSYDPAPKNTSSGIVAAVPLYPTY